MRAQINRAFTALAAVAALSGAAAAETLAPDVVRIEDMTLDRPLTDRAGDPERGREIFAARKLGNCLACHVNSDLASELFHGEVGPAVDGAGTRWSPAELRAIVVNSKKVFGEETIMPGFYTLDVGVNVDEKFAGKTILTAQEVEDVVAYLTTLNQE